MRKALVLLLLLCVVVVSALWGCSHDATGPVPTDSNATGPGPTEPGPTVPEPTGPTGPEFPQGVFGMVFEDANANGIRDAGEPGLPDVLVSNGIGCRATNGDGVYNLPSDNSLVFITTPGDYTSTGPWYSSLPGHSIDFGLRKAPEKESASFTFVQVTDLHASEEQTDALEGLVADLNTLSPAFVVATGDLIFDGNDARMATAQGWFDVYENFTSELAMPVYQAMGNHDVVGIHRADAVTSDPGYGEGLFVSRFGPTYYSFDWGRYHCIVLDPNDLENGKQVYRISEAQMRWLADDLSYREEAPLLVFFHEPTVSWTNRAAVLDLLQGHSATLFCGHLHQDVTLDSAGMREQVTAAVCGEWWHGANLDGKPPGYRLVSVQGDRVEGLYMGTGEERTVDFGLSPVLSGTVPLAVKIHSRSGPVSAVTCRVDDNQTVAVTVEDGWPWAVARGSWDTASLSEGYHRLTLRAADAAGTFEKEFLFKESLTGTVSLSDLTGHRDVFRGSYVAVQAQVSVLVVGPVSVGSIDVPPGVGVLLLRDGSDALIVFAGDVFSPSLTDLWWRVLPGDQVIVKVVLLRLTMAQITSGQEWNTYYPLLTSYLSQIPASALEPPDAASIAEMTAIWGARWLSADDLTLKPD